MGFWATFYSLLTLAMFGICASARAVSEDADRIARAASWVVLFTGLSRLVGFVTDAPWSLVHYPGIDLFMLYLSFGWWQVRGEKWAWLLGCCFLAQLCLHAWFWWGADPDKLYLYLLLNNISFAVSLAILSVAGGGYVAGWVHDRLSLPRRRAGDFLAYGASS